MFERLRHQWHTFIHDPPGRRFALRHRRMSRASRAGGRALVVTLAAALLVLVGVPMLVLPGPGLLCLIVAAALFAERSRWAAQGMDQAELALRRAARRGDPRDD